MGFLRNIVGTVIAFPLLCLISTATDLQLLAAVDILVQWAGALFYALPMQSEKYYDLTGCLTHSALAVLAYVQCTHKNWRQAMLTVMVCCWSVRLALFLFRRILKRGQDVRFVDIRVSKLRFFSAWTIQGLWIFVCDLPVLLSQRHSIATADVQILDIVGIAVWVLGYVLELVADHQKFVFRFDPRNKGKFIHHGLWNYSRHPNYFGEILMWFGIFFIVVHGMPTTAFQVAAASGLVFVAFLLVKVSGLPWLEEQAEKTWGKLKEYQKYKRQTSVLIPWFKKA